MNCSKCGLHPVVHTDEKCAKILYAERDALLGALEQSVDLLGKTTRTLRTVVKWVKGHKAQEVLKAEHPLVKR